MHPPQFSTLEHHVTSVAHQSDHKDRRSNRANVVKKQMLSLNYLMRLWEMKRNANIPVLSNFHVATEVTVH